MVQELSPPLSAKNGHTLRVLLICRVSCPGEGKQDERSLDDQEALLRRWLADRTSLPLEVDVIAGDGSGERLDRVEVQQAHAAVESREYDVVVTEDLGRFLRRIHAMLFCELGEDSNTRVIALNDQVDTAQETWRMSAFFASMRHELYNADTGKRIRGTKRNRFPSGGAFPCEIYGYIKPDGAKSDEEVYKDSAAEPVYEEWFRRLEDGENYAEVADWLNSKGILPGPHSRNQSWDRKMVARVTHNEILKGLRTHNKRMAKHVNSTGRRKSVKAPASELLERHCPHLAFIEPQRYDRVIAMLAERNQRFRRQDEHGADCRKDVPKKRSRYPGQCIVCGICGRQYVFGGHGQTDHLMCDGAKSYCCWNGVSVDGPLAAEKLSQAVLAEIEALEGFDDTLSVLADEEAQRINASLNDRLQELDRELSRIDAAIANIVKAIGAGSYSAALSEELARLEERRRNLQRDKLCEGSRIVEQVTLPAVDELKALARTKFRKLAIDSYEFAAEFRRLTPRIVVFPHQLLGDGQPVLRAKFRLQLAQLVAERGTRAAVQPMLERLLTVDLFNSPQREAFRAAVVAGRRTATEREVAAELGITVTAAQQAMTLQRLMEQHAVEDPYLPLAEPPGTGRMRRHRHARYRFEPLPDAGEL